MNGAYSAINPPSGMFVRALYNYDADDHTSLSFRQGDIIQVITQLESGWWDGVIGGVQRGWFPSNYCEVVSRPEDDVRESHNGTNGIHDTDGEESQDDYTDQEYEDVDTDGNNDDISRFPIEGGDDREQGEAAFWIPQATPDGRLFYFNTLTGVSAMELPLETPTTNNESGPRDRTNVYIPEQTRVPPELMAGGYERDEDTDFENSASEAETHSGMNASGSLPSRNRSFANGISHTTSMDSMKKQTLSRERVQPSYSSTHGSMSTSTSALNTYATNSSGAPLTAAMSRKFFDDQHAVPLTWNRLVEDMRRSVERYRQAINNSDRSEFVSRAEDISDHLRLLLAAGSGTTDNHSGNPSIISTNKALYPHFRETMSRFSKLVLSSHIASSDWPPPDSYVKCLKEADGVLNGVYGFVEVARQQRGEEIPRLIPGFVVGSHNGGSWLNNGLSSRDPLASMSFIEQDDSESSQEPNIRLEGKFLERMEELRRVIIASIRRLEEQLTFGKKLITPYRHKLISDSVCKAGAAVLQQYKPWLSCVESINLAPLGSDFQNPQLLDFSVQKQRVYDLLAELVLACQAVGAPLADEWAEMRGLSLDERLSSVRATSRELESNTAQLYFSLQLLSEVMPADDPSVVDDDFRITGDGDDYHDFQPKNKHHNHQPNLKALQLLGDAPPPEFLKLDHEEEIQYDTRAMPPQVKGGTLTGLVEQLTRHDKLDATFNSNFLLTYRSFTTASELFEMLVKRWSIQPPFGLAKGDYQTWVEKKQKVVRVRVVNIIKRWFDDYWMEGNDEDAQQLIQRVYSFAKDHVATTTAPSAQTLMKSVEERSRGHDATSSKRLVLTLNTSTPQPILPKNMRKLKFLDIDITEFARQLTIIESRLYGKIKPTECLNKTWQKKVGPGEPEPASNVRALILHSNQLTNWVAEMILQQGDVRRRVMVIKHFVGVADKCRILNNFSTLTAIISALSTAPIHRLNRTWSSVNARTTSTLENIRRLMNRTRNFAEYRETLHRAQPPCIPFLGVYLTDLTFIEDGIPSQIKRTDLINFQKRAKTAEVIKDIQQYQNVPYGLQPVPELQDFIIHHMQSAGDVHEMYDLSLQVEPREREDEKIARLLSESGFL